MTHFSAAEKTDLAILHSRATHLKEGLKETDLEKKSNNHLERMAEAIARQFELEERTMERIGTALTPIHIDEHKKILEAIALLEFSWKAKRISDEVYIKALHHKFAFHQHYFDMVQLVSIHNRNSNSG